MCRKRCGCLVKPEAPESRRLSNAAAWRNPARRDHPLQKRPDQHANQREHDWPIAHADAGDARAGADAAETPADAEDRPADNVL